MARDLTLSLRLLGQSTGLDRALRQAQGSVRRFGSAARREFEAIKRAASSLAGKLAGLGAGFTLGKMIADSAHLTRNLAQTQRTAKMTTAELAAMRAEFFALGRQTAVGPEALAEAAQTLAAAGLSKGQITGALPAVAKAMGTTQAQADVLAQALTVAAEQFQFDLSNPTQALKILDQMAKAGDLGSAELQSLSDIFARVGQRAKTAGLGFEQTLGFIEALSKQEKNPERLATLADSLLRLWTNAKYMEAASEATGVKFLTAKGARRPMVEVLKDFRREFQRLNSEGQKIEWLSEAFGKADLDTLKGIQMFLQTPGMVEDFAGFSQDIQTASGFLEQGLSGALNNAIDQAERLKIVLREAAEAFTLPIEKTFNRAVQWALDEQQLSGGEIAGGAAAGAAGLYALSRLGKGLAGRLAGRGLGLAGGVAAGAALEAAAGVTPVFVTNWPAGGLGGALGAGASAAGGTAAGGAAAGGAAAGVAAKGLLGAAGLAGAAAAMMLYPQKLGHAEAMTQGPLGWGKEALYPGLRLLEETSDQGVAMIDQHAGQAQQQLQTLGDQSAAVIQQQGQSAQAGIQAATAEFNAAAANLAAVLARPQQVNVTVGLNSNMLNAYVDRRNEVESRRFGTATEGGF